MPDLTLADDELRDVVTALRSAAHRAMEVTSALQSRAKSGFCGRPTTLQRAGGKNRLIARHLQPAYYGEHRIQASPDRIRVAIAMGTLDDVPERLLTRWPQVCAVR